MPTLNVTIPFSIKMDPVNADGTPRDPTLPLTYVFPVPGTYDVPDEVSSHWFTAPHLVGYVEPPHAESMGVEVMVPIETPPEGGDGGTVSGAARGGVPIGTRQPDPIPARPTPETKADTKR